MASDGHILLTDFGLSKESLEEEGARSIVGSAEFMAPEILNLDYYNEMVKTGDEPLNKPPSYSFSVDYWSLGILIFDMLTGHPPFTGGNNKTIMTKILNTKLKIPNYLSSYSKDIIIKLLKKTPSARISREMLFKHDFFRQIDFDKLFRKEIQPPHIPTIQDPTDLSHFNQEFTRMNVCDTPIASSECVDCGITCKCKNKFIGFSFEDLRRT